MQGSNGRLSRRSNRGRRGLTRRSRGPKRIDHIRAQLLRDFRGVGEALDLEKNVSRAGELLQGILKDLRLNEGIEESRLKEAWHEVAGSFVARQTEPVSLHRGVLTLRVLQPSMRFHLEQSRGQLLGRLRKRLGAEAVREVRLTIG